MTYKPESKLTVGERLVMLRRCLRTGIGLEQLCEIFDASAEDLRRFVKLNDASLSDAFESLVKKAGEGRGSKSYVSQQQHRLHKRLRMNAVAKRQTLAGDQTGSQTASHEPDIIDVMRERLLGNERAFDLLPEDRKEEIRQEAALFISWRESLQLGVRQLR